MTHEVLRTTNNITNGGVMPWVLFMNTDAAEKPFVSVFTTEDVVCSYIYIYIYIYIYTLI